jgi:1-acyl-sn-glycerol-3-phosphate acyltransferase
MKYLWVFLLCVVVVACAGFKYKYYGIEPLPGEELRGTLLGKEPKDDLSLSRCQPDDVSKGKCVVMFVEDWERLVTDYVEMQKKLEDCKK